MSPSSQGALLAPGRQVLSLAEENAKCRDPGPTVAGNELRSLFRQLPSPVGIVTVDVGGQAAGLTVDSLVSLSLEPPLVGVALRRHAALHELLREAGSFAVSILGGGQEHLAQHFARGVPPIGLWTGIDTRAGELGAPLIEGALG